MQALREETSTSLQALRADAGKAGVTKSLTLSSAPGGATSHYEKRGEDYYIVWEADFYGDESGKKKLAPEEITEWVKSIAVEG